MWRSLCAVGIVQASVLAAPQAEDFRWFFYQDADQYVRDDFVVIEPWVPREYGKYYDEQLKRWKYGWYVAAGEPGEAGVVPPVEARQLQGIIRQLSIVQVDGTPRLVALVALGQRNVARVDLGPVAGQANARSKVGDWISVAGRGRVGRSEVFAQTVTLNGRSAFVIDAGGGEARSASPESQTATARKRSPGSRVALVGQRLQDEAQPSGPQESASAGDYSEGKVVEIRDEFIAGLPNKQTFATIHFNDGKAERVALGSRFHLRGTQIAVGDVIAIRMVEPGSIAPSTLSAGEVRVDGRWIRTYP